MTPSGRTRRLAAVAGSAAVAATGAAIAGSLAGASYFARKVLTPEAHRPDDTEIRRVGDDEVTLGSTDDTRVPGRYGLWFDEGRAHLRVGAILRLDPDAGEVTRRLLSVDRGELRPGPGRWNGYYYWSDPLESLGRRYENVAVLSTLGSMPAWLVAPDHPSGRWTILVHGRSGRREETLRAVPALLALGDTCLIASYRNDPGAPRAPDGRLNLGLSEWRDIEAAMVYAVEHGAHALTLVGWSMGGAIVLQTLARSWLSDSVDTVVLDSPVIDWTDVLRHHARLHGIPPVLRDAGTLVMGRRSTRRLAGVHEPVDVAKTNWVARSAEIRHRVLVIHSLDDEFVPVGPTRALAEARPDLVTWDAWTKARHCKEWNLDSARWTRTVGDWLTEERRAATGP